MASSTQAIAAARRSSSPSLGAWWRKCSPDGLREEERLLEHQADLTAEALPFHFTDVHAADGDGPLSLRQVIEPVQEMDQGALTGAGAAQNGEGAACRDGEGYVPQHRLPLIAEAHMVEFNVAGGGLLSFRDVLLLPGPGECSPPGPGRPQPCSYPTAHGPGNVPARPGPRCM